LVPEKNPEAAALISKKKVFGMQGPDPATEKEESALQVDSDRKETDPSNPGFPEVTETATAAQDSIKRAVSQNSDQTENLHPDSGIETKATAGPDSTERVENQNSDQKENLIPATR
jgi:hypothetical protein